MSKFFWMGSIGTEVLFCLGLFRYCSDCFVLVLLPQIFLDFIV